MAKPVSEEQQEEQMRPTSSLDIFNARSEVALMRVLLGIVIAPLVGLGLVVGLVNPPSVPNACRDCADATLPTSHQRGSASRSIAGGLREVSRPVPASAGRDEIRRREQCLTSS